ncbi:MAG: hypothetical protein AzoDbin1_01335 [Azoarcus sp.]|uniref:Uncharacterized protein n=1 Tax=Aromatoleum tolulyticum TaxID=34027 RepID=A0A1N6ZYV0_9RHOO|nr:hypothetical protein [Aromatoleum tolulyticum]MCK9984863.1 hypothetical protein [Azoarcus sp.]SIR32027.1 hypothetical protein SAMN05421829_1136 [Aromatoleum tolulyticum]
MRALQKFPVKVKAGEMPANFVRGFVATGLLAALQEPAGRAPAASRAVLKQALQGGTALAAGCAAADAWQRQDLRGVLVAVAGGAAGLAAIDYLARKSARRSNGKREKHLGQEETQESAA